MNKLCQIFQVYRLDKKIQIGKSVLIESGTDPNTNYWYRLWSDGWCEQGGVAQLDSKANYLRVYPTKEYKDTSYEVILTCGSNDGGWPVSWTSNANKQTSSFWIDGTGNHTEGLRTIKVNWITKGYINLED